MGFSLPGTTQQSTAKMEATVVFLLCAFAVVNGQLLNPMSSLGMGSGWGGPMWHGGVRYPGVMQTSQLSSMTYPTHVGWRSHPIFRMGPGSSEKNIVSSLASDILNVPKVPSAQEVLTHMVLNNQNPKPFLDTISDFLYEPQKTRTVLSPVASVSPVGPVPPVVSMSNVDSPMYMQGMNLMRANAPYGDDCGPEGGRWERGMDWLY